MLPGEVLAREHLPDRLGRHLAAVGVGALLDDPAELDLRAPRQVELVLGLEDVGHPALAGLAVDPDHGLVGATDVLGVDREVRHRPRVVGDGYAGLGGVAVEGLEALLDGVLVGAGERGVDEVAAVGVPLGDRQLVAVLDRAPDLVDVGEVDLRVDALGEEVQPQGHQADVAGALAVAEEAALDPVGAGQVAELGGRDRRTPVVVGVQAEDDVLAVVEVAVHPLDGVGVDVGGGHLDGRRQVDDDRPLGGRLEDLEHLVADADRELQLGAGVGLRRVLVEDGGLGDGLLELLAQPGALDGDVADAVLVEAEDHPALQRRGRVVEVHDRLLGAAQRLVGALDELLASLGQHLDHHVVGDQVLLDQHPHEVEVGLRGRREADLDLLVAHGHEQLEHLLLAGRGHRLDEGLVAVAQVDRAPARRGGDGPVRPGPVTEGDRHEGDVAVERHAAGVLAVHEDSSGGP